MNYLPFAIAAYFFNSISVTINKILLNKTIPDPFVYVFYVSVFSLILLPGLPFVHIPKTTALLLSSISTLLWTIGAYLMFKALKVGFVSRVIPIIATLIPLFLLAQAALTSSVSINQSWAVGFLVLGLIFITIFGWTGKFKKKEAIFELFSAIFFALSYLLLNLAYQKGEFLSILIYSRVILVPFILLILLLPKLRKKVTHSKEQRINLSGKSGIIFLTGQIAGGAAELLLLFSISLAHPALVNSLQGTQYIFLMFFGLFLKEKYTKLSLATKLTGILFIGLGLYISAFSQTTSVAKIGVTYSPRYAIQLGLNPKTTFIKMLSDLNLKYLRLPVYWDEVETFPNDVNFSGIDFYLNEALKKNVSVVLVLGYKQPRWPECFTPVWVENLLRLERDRKILNLVAKEIAHFKNYQNIIAWQIENEPFLTYGNCDLPNQNTYQRLEKEIDIVKQSDQRPIILTDSGELGSWIKPIKQSDIFGTTIYREVWNPILGQFNYPLPPVFYTIKNNLARLITGPKGETIISELQMEPWINDKQLPSYSSLQNQLINFPAAKLAQNLQYARETKFSAIYLWGVEWWYFMDAKGYPQYLETAKKLFKEN